MTLLVELILIASIDDLLAAAQVLNVAATLARLLPLRLLRRVVAVLL